VILAHELHAPAVHAQHRAHVDLLLGEGGVTFRQNEVRGRVDARTAAGPRAETASMLRKSLPFQPTLLAISSSNSRALPTSPPARHAGRQPSPADLAGQAV
jgi:hypothetical protein